MDPEIQAAYAQSFRGKLYLCAFDRYIPLRLSRTSDKFSWGVTPENDWLQAGGEQNSPTMDFTFDSQTDDRLHFQIAIPGPRNMKKLGVSLNGYLGFYWFAEVKDFWKIEPLMQTDAGLFCHLRDHLGQRVGFLKDFPHRSRQWVALLNVKEGETCTFLLKKIP